MSLPPPPPADITERERATTTFDRNVVVTASAGTGKTTLLVNRFLFALLYLPEPVPIGEIVALTFTNKAAGEVKTRLRERLTACVSEGRHPLDEAMARVPLAVIQSRAAEALRDLDRCVVERIRVIRAAADIDTVSKEIRACADSLIRRRSLADTSTPIRKPL